MSDIYRRLKTKGFEEDFVREFVLPEWWEDSLAAVPANRALAESYISRDLGFTISELHAPTSDLSLSLASGPRFKRYKNQVDERVLAAALVAQRAATLISAHLGALPPYEGDLDGRTARQKILEKKPYVDLESLLGFCWERGIVVFHLARTPQRSKPFSGMAMFCGERPVIVLGSKRDAPAWNSFHLAHELAHILSGHVEPGRPALADADLTTKSPEIDEVEHEADRVACEILTGNPDPRPALQRWDAAKLALEAKLLGPRHGVDPGIYTLIYGKVNNRWGVAQNALKILRADTGAHRLVEQALAQHLCGDELSESAERFLNVLSLPT